jgi:hypothetical protein
VNWDEREEHARAQIAAWAAAGLPSGHAVIHTDAPNEVRLRVDTPAAAGAWAHALNTSCQARPYGLYGLRRPLPRPAALQGLTLNVWCTQVGLIHDLWSTATTRPTTMRIELLP